MIKGVLNDFMSFFGHVLKANKSQIFFSSTTKSEGIMHVLSIDEAFLPVRYLGFPLFAGCITKIMCLHFLDKMRKRLDTWKSRLLSMDGRLDLIVSTLADFSIFGLRLFLFQILLLMKQTRFVGSSYEVTLRKGRISTPFLGI